MNNNQPPLNASTTLNSMDQLLLEAISCHQEEEFETAEKICSTILEYDSQNVRALSQRGDARRMQRKFGGALLDLTKADQLKPNDADILGSLGSVHLYINRPVDGLKILEKAIALRTNSSFLMSRIGYAKLLLGRYEESLQDLNQTESIEPNMWYTLWKRGIVHRKLGKLTESYNDLKLADSMQPENNGILADYAETCRQMGLHGAALHHLKDSETEFALIVKAQIYLDLGKVSKCESILKNVERDLEDMRDIESFKEVKKCLTDKKAQQQMEQQAKKNAAERRKSISGELDANLCVICMDNPRDTVVLPCLHFLYCSVCISQYTRNSHRCPSCRSVSTGSLTCRMAAEPSMKQAKMEKEKKEESDEDESESEDEEEEEEEDDDDSEESEESEEENANENANENGNGNANARKEEEVKK